MARTKQYTFLLSPANLSGRRAQVLLREEASFELATRLRSTGASIGEVFSFISGLYFRGKLAYANSFSTPRFETDQPVLIITATHGLMSPEQQVDHGLLYEMAQVPIQCADLRYRTPLERDLARLCSQTAGSDEVILLGSIATSKYLDPLVGAFGERLMIPADFIGRGDMSRGAMLLRAVRTNVPLRYMSASELRSKQK